jgi:hypothetical protein
MDGSFFMVGFFQPYLESVFAHSGRERLPFAAGGAAWGWRAFCQICSSEHAEHFWAGSSLGVSLCFER